VLAGKPALPSFFFLSRTKLLAGKPDLPIPEYFVSRAKLLAGKPALFDSGVFCKQSKAAGGKASSFQFLSTLSAEQSLWPDNRLFSIPEYLVQ
jgi:hypothetical protein